MDIPSLPYVVNFDVPSVPGKKFSACWLAIQFFFSEEYVHRIGRTGRAGEAGK